MPLPCTQVIAQLAASLPVLGFTAAAVGPGGKFSYNPGPPLLAAGLARLEVGHMAPPAVILWLQGLAALLPRPLAYEDAGRLLRCLEADLQRDDGQSQAQGGGADARGADAAAGPRDSSGTRSAHGGLRQLPGPRWKGTLVVALLAALRSLGLQTHGARPTQQESCSA